MSLRLVVRPDSLTAGLRVDAALISPDRLAGLSPAAAACEPLPTSAGDAALGDLFTLAATDGPDDRLDLEGDLTRFVGLGAGMSRGSIAVRGDVGGRVGSGVRGGRLAITGNAGERAGEGMRGGILMISGAAGDHAGAPAAGRAEGQSGGVLIVRGRAGAGAGFRMRRGVLALGGAGAAVGAAMIAGTILLFEAPGPGAGAMMRRGTIVALTPFHAGAAFALSGPSDAPWLAPYWDALAAAGLPLPAGLAAATFTRYRGDVAEGAQGEILMREEAR